MAMMGMIYIFKNKLNYKCYVGQTVQPLKDRISAHIATRNSLLGRAIRKYGRDAFDSFEFRGIPVHLLDYAEINMIRRIGSISPRGYNLSLGGNGNSGGLSASHRAKIGLKHRGRHLSEETKKKLSIAHLGIPSPNKGMHQSEEAKRKSSLSHMGKIPWNRGIPMSAEARQKASKSLMGRKPARPKQVFCEELNRIFPTMRAAAKAFGIHEANIGSCCRGILKTSGGFHWRYYKEIA